MKNKILFQIFILTIPAWFLYGNLHAENAPPDSLKKRFGLFDKDDILNISLKFDLSTYFRAKPQKEYLKAKITFHPGEADSASGEIRLKTRGVFRNQYCMFAPIDLNFKKADFGYSDLNKISKIKLVPQCSSGKDKEDWVLREYLAYKLFNVLTDTSFRVRLVRVTYIDSENKRKKPAKPVIQYAFFIEPAYMLTARTNSIELTTANLNQKFIIPQIMDRMAIFNFMIGNYDWSVPGRHNVFVTKSKEIDLSGLAIAIPHDFDWTGLVNPTYAVPAEEIGTESVRDRLFLGICRKKEIYNKELDVFLEKKEQFYKVINDCSYIDQKAKKDMTDYLDGFYDMLSGKKDLILYNFTNTCKSF